MGNHLDIYNLPEIAKSYRHPALSMLPLFDRHELQWKPTEDTSRFLKPDAILTPSGRIAIYYALAASNVRTGDDVLVPAYHCVSMLEPVIHLGGSCVFYPLSENLEASLDALKSCLTNKTKALIVPHFFGFQQNMAPIRAWCDEVGIRLIEDCAHAFFAVNEGKSIGSVGHFAIASTVKFFPGTQGGAIVSNIGEPLEVDSNSPSWIEELRALKNILDLKRYYTSQPRNKADEDAIPDVTGKELVTLSTQVISKESCLWFDASELGSKGARVNRFLVKHCNSRQFIEKRIENYQYYLKKVDGSKGLKPFKAELNGAVPYVFPVILENAEEVFHKLKFARVPMWRWEELVVTDCNVSLDYRHKLIQLPCHQSISHEHIDWIIDTFYQLI